MNCLIEWIQMTRVTEKIKKKKNYVKVCSTFSCCSPHLCVFSIMFAPPPATVDLQLLLKKIHMKTFIHSHVLNPPPLMWNMIKIQNNIRIIWHTVHKKKIPHLLLIATMPLGQISIVFLKTNSVSVGFPW